MKIPTSIALYNRAQAGNTVFHVESFDPRELVMIINKCHSFLEYKAHARLEKMRNPVTKHVRISRGRIISNSP